MSSRRITVRGIIQKDGKLFLLRQRKNGGVNDYWCTPGGGLDDGEALLDGLHREMVEETGVAPQIGKLLYIQQYQDEEAEYLEFFFEITNVDDYETIDLASTTHGEQEVAEFGFVDTKLVYVLPKFLQQIDSSSNVQLVNY